MASTPLTKDEICSTLVTKSFGHCLYLYHVLPSTNSEALSLARAGAAHGTVVVADAQSSGRGRHTRNWFSPPGTNIYCSIIVREIDPGHALSQWLSWIPLASALAVANAVHSVAHIPVFLKWPNDLLLHERKVGGILCESTLQPTTAPLVVIGIGLNVNVSREAFPDDLQHIAASLSEVSLRSIDRNRLIAQLLLELERTLDDFRSHGPSRLRETYSSRCVTLGRRVRISVGPEHELVGTAESISANGALHVRPLSSARAAHPPPLMEVRAADVIHMKE